jgi:hypothetical protein
MTNPKYLVNISWSMPYISGMTAVSISGVTQSLPVYTSGYFVATMPEVRISATGSTYETALSNLLIIASASNDNGYPPLSRIRTW